MTNLAAQTTYVIQNKLLNQAEIFDWVNSDRMNAEEKGRTGGRLVTVACETMRCHYRRPGLFGAGAKQALRADEEEIDMSAAVATLQKVYN